MLQNKIVTNVVQLMRQVGFKYRFKTVKLLTVLVLLDKEIGAKKNVTQQM